MTANITRAEAAERAALLTVAGYEIDVDLTDVATSPTFPATTTVRFSARAPGSTWIDLIAAEVHHVVLDGQPVDCSGYDGARLALADLASGEHVLQVRASGHYMTTGEGLHRAVDPADQEIYLYTQCAIADARRVFACFEQPDLKATFAWAVAAPAEWEVRSNTAGPPARPLGGGLARWQFPPTPPLSTYLAAICAGPFHVISDVYEGPYGRYPLALLVRASVAEHLDADEVFDLTRAGLAHYEAMFAVPYPFGKYDQVALPEFNLGAMENPGLVTFNEDMFVFRSRVTEWFRERRAMILLHEMAHMWFGDLVTMRWWDDLWLNESFAEWAGFGTTAGATRFTSAWTSFVQARKAWAYAQDQQPSTHPIAADMVDLDTVHLNIDGITYAKGASVVKALVAYVGQPAFEAGLTGYLRAHAWGSATLEDLLRELEASSGRDLRNWARDWLQAPGVTVLAPVVHVGPDGNYTRVAIEQLPATRPDGITDLLRPHRVALGVYRWGAVPGAGQRALLRTERVEVDLLGGLVEVPELVGTPAADLLLVNDDDLTYAKVRFDPVSLGTLRAGIGDLVDPLPRSLAWTALWELVRDSELPAQDFVAIALAGLIRESRPLTLELVLGQARVAVARYVAPELRSEQAQLLATSTRDLLVGAEPGSERQLELARAHVASAQEVGWLAELLAGEAALPGLVLDSDLSWAVVVRLATLGAADHRRIDSELAGDRTSKGAQSAARARACIPTAAAKEAAWAAAMEPGGLPTAVLEAVVAGFADETDSADLRAPYRARYAEQILDVWAARSPAEGAVLARGMFPGVDLQTVMMADELLARADLPAGLARVLAERRADTVLALAAQEASRSAADR
ncbi:MAG: aminopeptidase N [Candidatus Nanopelagicales bacterium]